MSNSQGTTEMKNTERIQFGFWLYLMSDAVLFAGLFATYAVLQNAVFGGATIHEILNLPFVLVETLILLTSSFTIGLALLAARESAVRRLIIFLFVTLLLGLAFLGLELTELRNLVLEGNGPSRSAFLSAFFTLLGTHGLHVAIGSLVIAVFIAQLWLKGLSERMRWRLLCLGLFWHFLDVVWIFIFTFVYLFGVL
jgi:cytochrome o ubiquinol oxidase subunit III